MWFIKLFQGLYETATIIKANTKRSNINILITKIWATIYLINVIIELTGHSVIKVAIMNAFVVIGTVLSIMIPGLMPEN